MAAAAKAMVKAEAGTAGEVGLKAVADMLEGQKAWRRVLMVESDAPGRWSEWCALQSRCCLAMG